MKSIKYLFIFLGLFILDILYSHTIVSILKEIGLDITKISTINKNIIYILIEISFIIILYLIYRKDLKKEFTLYKNNFKKDFTLGFKLWILGLLIMLISNIIINKFYGSPANNNVAVLNELKKMPIYMLFSACIAAPFCEEIIFRKSLRNIFKSDIIFILFSGLIFGFIHTMASTESGQLLYMIPYGTFGIIFGYMYVKTNSIMTSMTFHMIHNTLLTLMSLYTMGVI